MRIFFTLILCTTLTFVNTHTSCDPTPQKAAGVAIITVVAGGILYLVKSNADKAQRLELLSEEIAEVKDATQIALRISDEALQAYYALGLIAGSINNRPIVAPFNRLLTYKYTKEFLHRYLPNPKPIVSQ